MPTNHRKLYSLDTASQKGNSSEVRIIMMVLLFVSLLVCAWLYPSSGRSIEIQAVLTDDPDQCTMGTHLCGNHSTCVRTGKRSPFHKGYTCVCDEGYALIAYSDTDCDDIDECQDPFRLHKCPLDSTCKNTAPMYECQCDDKDENPCTGGAKCDRKRTDDETGGKDDYTCKCPPGSTYIGGSCKDIDECAMREADDNICGGIYNRCENLIVSSESTNTLPYTCECKPGYEKVESSNGVQPATCVDINECEKGLHNCGDSNYNQCQNIVKTGNGDPNYTCDCDLEYYAYSAGNPASDEQPSCEDINECDLDRHDCGVHSTCVNKVVTSTNTLPYMCECDRGYRLGVLPACGTPVCLDIDECIDSFTPHQCRASSTCHNLAVNENNALTYMCECNAGYKEVGLESGNPICYDIDECIEVGDDNEPLFDCHSNTLCTNQLRESEGDLGYTCEDIDECANGEHVCPVHSTCVNLIVTATGDEPYMCNCDKGYYSEEGTNITPTIAELHGDDLCVDVDECANEGEQKRCGGTSECVNGIIDENDPDDQGGYQCECPYGYKYVGSGADGSCEDIDECQDKTHKCGGNSKCVNKELSSHDEPYRCICDEGYGYAFRDDGLAVCSESSHCGTTYDCGSVSCSPPDSEHFECGCTSSPNSSFQPELAKQNNVHFCITPDTCIGDECFHKLLGGGRNWGSAKDACAALTPDTKVGNEGDSSWMLGLAKTKHSSLKSSTTRWIGLKRNGSKSSDGFKWLDGKLQSKHSGEWASGQPDDGDNRENCVVLINGEWVDRRCTVVYDALCSRKGGTRQV